MGRVIPSHTRPGRRHARRWPGHRRNLQHRTRPVPRYPGAAAVPPAGCLALAAVILRMDMDQDRSEEHTSELPSLMRNSYAVFCLKKKNSANKKTKINSTDTT